MTDACNCELGPERWAPVPGFEQFEASDHGWLRTTSKGLVQPKIEKHGHYQVGLRACRAGKVRTFKLYFHVAVLMAFIGPRPEGAWGLHWDDVPSHNHLPNLRWGTPAENMLDQVRNGNHVESRKTHCPREHLLVLPNLIRATWRDGRRSCLACSRAAAFLRNRGINFTVRDELFKATADTYYAKIMEEVAA